MNWRSVVRLPHLRFVGTQFVEIRFVETRFVVSRQTTQKMSVDCIAPSSVRLVSTLVEPSFQGRKAYTKSNLLPSPDGIERGQHVARRPARALGAAAVGAGAGAHRRHRHRRARPQAQLSVCHALIHLHRPHYNIYV